MKQLLCFGDSNTWGYSPVNGERYPWGVRWTSLLEEKLEGWRVLEEGLCGRTSKVDDPNYRSRSGLELLPIILESNEPLDAAIIMLGTNDCKTIFRLTPQEIAEHVGLCIDEMLKYIKANHILMVSPIYLGDKVFEEGFDPDFDEISVEVSHGLGEEYAKVAASKGVHFLNAADFVGPSEEEQEHMDVEGHETFANVIYEKLGKMLEI